MSQSIGEFHKNVWAGKALLIASVLGASGCTSPAFQKSPQLTLDRKAGTAEQFLKWSMDRYASAKTLRIKSTCGSRMKDERVMTPFTATNRLTEFESPNKFRVEARRHQKTMIIVVCDGKRELETYPDDTPPITQTFQAPDKIWNARNPTMRQPLFAYTPLYLFFGGSSNYKLLVDPSKGEPEFGPEVLSPKGENRRTVRFYGAKWLGNVSVQIGEKSGWVYKVEYDREPFMKMVAKEYPKGFSVVSVEEYEIPTVDVPISSATFDLKSGAVKKLEVPYYQNPI